MFCLAVEIQTTTAYFDGKRVNNKLHCCVFCSKLYYRISRHLKTHRKEDEIKVLKQISSIKDRRKELDRLRLRGDFLHNQKVIEENNGQLIVARCPSENDRAYKLSDFTPCEYCKGYFIRWELWRHQVSCQFKPPKKDLRKRNRPQRNSVIFMESSKQKPIDETFLEDIVSRMIIDDVSMAVRHDSIAMKYGELTYTKLSKDKSKKSTVSSDLRLLGRLILAMRLQTGKQDFYLSEFLKVKYFDDLIKVAHNLADIDQTKDQAHFNKPSVGQKIGRLLTRCCIVLDGEAMRKNDEEEEKNATRLKKLIKNEWSFRVNAISHKTTKDRRRNNPVVLPTTKDLLKLKQYLESEMKNAKVKLLSEKTIANYQNLSELVLCRLIMFNRRRSGEVSETRVVDYLNRPDWRNMVNHEIFQSLCPIEKKLVERYVATISACFCIFE